MAQVVVTVADVEALPGETVTFSLSFTGGQTDTYTSLQFGMTLPTGITKASSVPSSFSSSWPGASGSVDENVACASSEVIAGTAVENLVTISLNVANTVDVGSYDVTLSNIQFRYGTEGAHDDAANITFKINVVERHTVVLDETLTTAPTATTDAVNVCVKRTINANEWSTICLPFAMSATQVKAAFGNDVQLGDFTSYDTMEDTGENVVGLTVNFNMVTAMEANHPYVIKVSNAISEFTADNVTIDPEEEPCVEYDNGFTGKKRVVWGSFTGTYVADCVIPYEGNDASLFLSGNKWWYASAQTNHMKGYRAYFWFIDLLPEVSASRIQMAFNDETTSLSEEYRVKSEEFTSATNWYTVDGRKLTKQPTKKGVYVRGGKKIVIK